MAAPAGGAWSMYTNWEQDGSKQWETFLADELPSWLAANKGLAPTGHGIVGAAQGGTGALTMATFHPDRYRYAGSLSGFLTPSNTYMNGAITAGLAQYGGVDIRNMWGLPQLGRWKWHDPDVHVQLLADNNTRLWVFSPQTLGCSDPAAMIGYCDQAQGSTGRSISTTARWAAITGTSTSPSTASTTGRRGARSSPRCPGSSSPRSNEPVASAGTLEGCSTRFGVGRGGRLRASSPVASLLPSEPSP